MSSSKVLIVGSTGYIGKFVTKASVEAGHPTFVLIRPSTLSDPAKIPILNSFKEYGVTILEGSLEDRESLVAAIQLVDVVISTVGGAQCHLQLDIIDAIKQVGHIKRFVPSEFGMDVDRATILSSIQTGIGFKRKVRRALEQQDIPHTIVCNVAFAGIFLRPLWQLGADSPPRDKIKILGSGEQKVVFGVEEDIAAYTIRTIDDPQTVNKRLIIRPKLQTSSQLEVLALWEEKIGKKLEKIYISDEEVLKLAEAPPGPIVNGFAPLNIIMAIRYALLVKGDLTNFDLGPGDVEASEQYPDVQYTSIDEYLSKLV